jgi:hypothetical protein
MNSAEDGGRVSKELFLISAQPDEGYLFLHFPGHPDIFTQARYFNEIELMAKDAIYLMRDIPKDQIELKVESPIPLDFPNTYLGFLHREFINKVRRFINLRALHPAPSADGQ